MFATASLASRVLNLRLLSDMALVCAEMQPASGLVVTPRCERNHKSRCVIRVKGDNEPGSETKDRFHRAGIDQPQTEAGFLEHSLD